MAWEKGQSGNPSGRRRDAFISKARNRIQRRVPAILDRLAELAESGDTAAAKLLLERIVPVLKPVDVDLMADIERRLEQLESQHE